MKKPELTMKQTNYNTDDLTDQQWQCLQPYLSSSDLRENHLRQWDQRLILRAIWESHCRRGNSLAEQNWGGHGRNLQGYLST